MPNVDDLKTSKYLTKNDCEPPILVTIEKWDKVDVSKASQPADIKYVLYFKEEDKGMVLNHTNGKRIAKIASNADFDNWIGKQIVLYNDPTVEFGGEEVGGIRVRAAKLPESAEPTPPSIPDEKGSCDQQELPWI